MGTKWVMINELLLKIDKNKHKDYKKTNRNLVIIE